MSVAPTLYIATRGSALALVQANMILARCREAFPHKTFELKIIKTTGDKLQTTPAPPPAEQLTKGLFTKELELALLADEAVLAVHSLKDLPTELPQGLILGAVSEREDVRDVLIYRDAAMTRLRGLKPGDGLRAFAQGATIATSSTRRQAQILAVRPDLNLIPVRGNVGTRLNKLAAQSELDGIVLAAAGLHRLGFQITAEGRIIRDGSPDGLLAVYLSTDEMLPCVGQAALGIEIHQDNAIGLAICQRLNNPETMECVTAERAFLRGMGGGCLSPVAALGTISGPNIHLRAISFRDGKTARAESEKPLGQAATLGGEIAARLLA